MIVHPAIGEQVRVHYAKRRAALMPHHGRIGTVRIVSRGPGPRNHGVEIDGAIVAIPCGNLNRPQSAERTSPTNRTHPRRPSPPDRADPSAASRAQGRQEPHRRSRRATGQGKVWRLRSAVNAAALA